MKKYESFDIIKKIDIQQFKGLQNEVITHFHNPKGILFPISISCFGITYPTNNYYIKRASVSGYILEHIIEGKGYVIVNGKKTTVTAGDTYMLKTGESVEYYSDNQAPYKKLWVNFQGSLPTQIVSIYKLRETVYKNVELVELFEKLYELEKISTDISEIHFEIANIITQMLLSLAKSVEDNRFIPERANLIRVELNHAINTSFNLEKICEKLFISKSEVIRIFKKSYGITPYQYLLDLKISKAKSILESGTASVKEISEILCFSSPYHFSEVFKHKIGISPLQYRKKMRGE